MEFDNELLEIVKIDNKAPKFNLPYYDPITDDEGKINLEDLKNKWVVLFYYPADFTFVCPTELKDMASENETFYEL
jgi:peroxiredoxin (alkyl hydroperoxide reductase subunit C)